MSSKRALDIPPGLSQDLAHLPQMELEEILNNINPEVRASLDHHSRPQSQSMSHSQSRRSHSSVPSSGQNSDQYYQNGHERELRTPSTPPTAPSAAGSEADRFPAVDPAIAQARRQQSELASQRMGDLMLQGWAMLGEECENAQCWGIPLMGRPKRENDPRKLCVICRREYVTAAEASRLEQAAQQQATILGASQVNGYHESMQDPFAALTQVGTTVGVGAGPGPGGRRRALEMVNEIEGDTMIPSMDGSTLASTSAPSISSKGKQKARGKYDLSKLEGKTQGQGQPASSSSKSTRHPSQRPPSASGASKGHDQRSATPRSTNAPSGPAKDSDTVTLRTQASMPTPATSTANLSRSQKSQAHPVGSGSGSGSTSMINSDAQLRQQQTPAPTVTTSLIPSSNVAIRPDSPSVQRAISSLESTLDLLANNLDSLGGRFNSGDSGSASTAPVYLDFNAIRNNAETMSAVGKTLSEMRSFHQ